MNKKQFRTSSEQLTAFSALPLIICSDTILISIADRQMTASFQETSKALSDPVRRKILTMLKKGRLSDEDTASGSELSHAAVSYHPSRLKQADLIYETKVKNYIFCELNTTISDDLILWIKQFSKEDKRCAAKRV